MSEVITVSVIVASQVATSSVVAPIALAGGAVAIAGGAIALGYALTNAPFWKEIEQARVKGLEGNGFVNLESFQNDFLDQTERNYERLLQVSTSSLPPEAYETTAALMALQNAEVVTAVAEEQFAEEFHDILASVQKVQEMSTSQIQSLNRRTADLLEKSLSESRRHVQVFVAQEFYSVMKEAGWTVKNEARTESGTAFLATNASGQSLAVCIDQTGTITTDMAGFSGRNCETAAEELFAALENRGIRINRKKEQPHYLFAGGAIINRVSKAEQILKNAEKHRVKLQSKKSLNSSTAHKSGEVRERARKGYLLNRLRNSML